MRTEPKEPDEQLVFFLRELLDGATPGLLEHTRGNRSLQFGRDFRIAQGLPHAAQRVHEVFHEVLDPTRAAAEVPLQTGSHHSPAESRSPAHGIVRIRNAQHALRNEVGDLAVEGRLQAVPDMTIQFLVQSNGLLADRGIEGHCSLDRFRRRFGSANDFHERDDVRRVEGVPDEDTLGVLALRLHDARRDP